MIKIKWTERFDMHRADVGLISLIVKSKPIRQGEKWIGYVISISGGNGVIRPETVYETAEDAKQVAIEIAKRQVAKMAAMFEEELEGEQP